MSLAYVYDPVRRKTISFDGVTEISHALSLKVETDADNAKGADYVNNARREPDQVTLSVIMSESMDTATGSNRIRDTLSDLVTLKDSRSLCQVITDLRAYTGMLLTDITVTRDDSNPSGWSGTLSFREATAATGTTSATVTKTNNNTSTASNKGTTASTKMPTIDLSTLHVL